MFDGCQLRVYRRCLVAGRVLEIEVWCFLIWIYREAGT